MTLSSSSMWVLGIELRLSGLAANVYALSPLIGPCLSPFDGKQKVLKTTQALFTGTVGKDSYPSSACALTSHSPSSPEWGMLVFSLEGVETQQSPR